MEKDNFTNDFGKYRSPKAKLFDAAKSDVVLHCSGQQVSEEDDGNSWINNGD